MKIKKLTFNIALIALMAAILEVSKFALSFIANVELVTFFVIIFSLHFKGRIFPALLIFTVVEGLIYGFGVWWIMYLYAWPTLALITIFLSKRGGTLTYTVVSAAFGLAFGLLCSIPYFFIGLNEGGISYGFNSMFSWWIAGIPFDIIHCISNGVITAVLFKPLSSALGKLSNKYGFT